MYWFILHYFSFLKNSRILFLQFCKECPWKFERDCFEFCSFQYSPCCDINPANSKDIGGNFTIWWLLQFIFHHHKVSRTEVFQPFVQIYSNTCCSVCEQHIFLGLFFKSEMQFTVCIKTTDFYTLILYPGSLLKVLFRFREFQVQYMFYIENRITLSRSKTSI